MLRLVRHFWLILAAYLHLAEVRAASEQKSDVPALLKQIFVGPTLHTNTMQYDLEKPTYSRGTVYFPCSGDLCGAWLYSPRHSTAMNNGISKPPVIIMGNGLGGERPFLDKYAHHLADMGFAIFSFDYRCWSDSQGHPRRWISPPDQLEDWLSAVKFVQTNLTNAVDVSRLSLWGTSFAGGHVITVASKLKTQIKAVFAQVPHLDGRLASAVNMMRRGALGNAVLSAASLADIAAQATQEAHVYVPLAGPVGSLAIMQLGPKDLEEYFRYKNTSYTTDPATGEIEGNWTKFLTPASLASDMSLRPSNPTDHIHKVTAPILIVAAKRDELCPYVAAVAAQLKAKNATLITFDIGHFGMYNPPFYGQSVAAQLEFFRKNGV